MLKAMFDEVMERRNGALLEQTADWLPARGAVLDIGSGTGHLAARLARDTALDVVTADVTDMHVTGPAPRLIADGELPFPADSFAGSMLYFMLHYPADPAALLAEAARVTDGPVIVVQSLHATRPGYVWLRGREFVWTTVAFQVSRRIGYIPRSARFTMNARRFYTAATLERDVHAAGLRVTARRVRRVLPDGSLVVAAWQLSRREPAPVADGLDGVRS